MTDEIYVRRACKNHFLVGYCIRFHIETRLGAFFSIIKILQPRYMH
jgi:hypothetical protein